MTTNLDPVQPTYIESGDHQLFATYHAADGSDSAVLVCPPWGWDEVASYRPRRAWAQKLAAAGHPSLRFDLPGTGNSSGSFRDEDLVAAWVEAVRVAAAWLRDASGALRVVALGLGLGGLLALEAVQSQAAIEELILWAAPLNGRSFVRNVRTFTRLQAWQPDSGGAGAVAALPPGWIEASGFILSAETIASLESLQPDGSSGGGLRRALLLGRSDAAPAGGVGERMREGGTEVTSAVGVGWSKMVSHPERSSLPLDTVERVGTWLQQGGGREPSTGSAAAAPVGVAKECAREAAGLRETTFQVEQPFGSVFGVLTEPTADRVPELCAVFLNAGAVRDTGPNRMWVETARRWAAQGVPSLRVDLEAIGDADGDPAGIPPGEEYFSPKYEAQVKAVLDALSERGAGSQFVLVGLCSGAYFAYRTALEDARVRAAFLINAGALVWRPGIFEAREARKATRVFQRRWLVKLMRQEVEWRKLVLMARSISRRAIKLLRRPFGGGGRRASWQAELEAELGRLQESGTRAVIAFSDGEEMREELEAIGFPQMVATWPNVHLFDLPGGDHTLRPVEGQIALRDLLDAQLKQQINQARMEPIR